MSQKKENIRTKRTRKLLRDALIALITEKGYHAVTVTDLADRAMINRATFYRYYEDKEDLLFRGMDEFFDSFVNVKRQNTEDNPAAVLAASLQHIRENKEFYALMLGPQGHPVFQERVRQYHLQIIHSRLQSALAGENAAANKALLAGFAAGALGGIIRAWIESGCSQDPRSLAHTTLKLIKEGAFPAKPDISRVQ